MLLQANDYVELHQRYGCTLQIGGSDQWGNIIAGVRLVRQKLGATVHALTVAAGDRLRRQEVRQVDRRRQPLARPGDDQPVCLVPVLLQHRRRRRDPLPAVVHLPVAPTSSPSWRRRRPSGRTNARPSGGWPRNSPRWCTGRRRRIAVELASQALFGRGELAGLDEPTLAAALREAASVAELRPGAPGRHHRPAGGQRAGRRARAPRGARSPRAVSTSTTSGSRATTGRRSRRTSCTARWLVLRRGKRNIAGVERVG